MHERQCLIRALTFLLHSKKDKGREFIMINLKFAIKNICATAMLLSGLTLSAAKSAPGREVTELKDNWQFIIVKFFFFFQIKI